MTDPKTITIDKIFTPDGKSTQKIILLKGIPGSGKSTYAEEIINGTAELEESIDPALFYRINKDSIRTMIHNDVYEFDKDLEDLVLQVERDAGIDILARGSSLIVDDTNLAKKHENYWRDQAKNFKCSMEVHTINVPLSTCIERDAARSRTVGASVIKKMYNQLNYLKTDPRIGKELLWEPDKPACIICDLDGTLSLMNGRNAFDQDVSKDLPNKSVIDLVLMQAHMGVKIIFLSGRAGTEVCKNTTEEWLKTHCNVIDYTLKFRAPGDYRKDNIIKEELYERHVKGKYNVKFVLDDRDQVVDLWRSLGLPCFQVYYGDF